MLVRTSLVIAAGVALVATVAPGTATAQVDRRFVEEPTGGIYLPATPLAGDHDARAVSANPAGLQFVPGADLILAWDVDADLAEASASGPGYGGFLATPIGGGLVPRLGLGVGVEWLRPSRVRLLPDPGTPLRLSVGTSVGLGRDGALGVAWRRFFDDPVLDPVTGADVGVGGLTTWDLGVTWRFGNHLAAGLVVRDLGAPRVGTVPVQRRYEGEAVMRPLNTSALELAVGGRVGEIRGDLDGWVRASARLTRGMYAHAAFETRALQVVETMPSGMDAQREDRELVATLGIEVSFGRTGLTAYTNGGLDEDGDLGRAGGTMVARLSQVRSPSLVPPPDRIERIELSGGLGLRATTRSVLRLRAIARDPAVRAVVLQIDGVGGGWATVQELREEVLRVRAAGKKVFAYLVSGTTRDYFLASAADKIFLDPAGGLRLTGFAATTLYFRGVFDKLGVNAQFEKIAEYKSAPESYTDLAPSAPALRMRDELYDSLYEELIGGIARARNLDRETVVALVGGGPYTAGDLKNDKRLVDAVGEPDQVAQLISVELGGLYPVGVAPAERDDRWDRPAVAVIYADGDIVDGESQTIPLLGRKLVGGETMVAALTAARLDPSVRAVVIRIDSPGGSALASELMSREVFALRGVKPVICSMGDVAASGGYFLAAGCDKIFAEPMTITGSIGIFYGKFDLSGLLAKLGVGAVTITRGDHADMEGYYRPYTDEERATIREKLTYLYGRFTGTVARGRSMTEAQVDAVGRGRVWSGKQAKGVGLVDELGGIGDAIDAAKRAAGLSLDARVRVVELPKPGGGLLSLLFGGIARARADAGADGPALGLHELAPMRELLRALPASLLVAPASAQARLPFEITWD